MKGVVAASGGTGSNRCFMYGLFVIRTCLAHNGVRLNYSFSLLIRMNFDNIYTHNCYCGLRCYWLAQIYSFFAVKLH